MRNVICGLLAVAALAATARAAGDADDVRTSLKQMAEQIAAGKYLDALGNYYAVNDGERDMAKASVELDDALVKLESAVRAKFGEPAWQAMGPTVHALPKGGYDSVDVKVTGELATITWIGEASPMLLRKVGSAWKVSIPDIIAWGMKQAGATDAQARELEGQVLEISADRVRRIVSGLTWLARDVSGGKVASAEDAKTVAALVMKGKKK